MPSSPAVADEEARLLSETELAHALEAVDALPEKLLATAFCFSHTDAEQRLEELTSLVVRVVRSEKCADHLELLRKTLEWRQRLKVDTVRVRLLWRANEAT
jgi:hypothetical protein